MAILYQAPAGRAWRRTVLAAAALSVGVALAWLLRPDAPEPAPARPRPAAIVANVDRAPPVATIDAGCDARCATAKVIVPATAACAASIDELASFGVRWPDAATPTPRFDRFAWLQAERGTVTLGGDRAEFRNAAGAYLPVDYECDFDPATLAVLEARARPRAPAPLTAAAPAER